ncbi:MAG: nucleotidyltransferase domain-containing protein, partial [Gammaproteobacteria bacterium]|nr:nucleotidyltransferase domain-containing protein [Gammaproteobacteria bacterium]
MEQEIIKFLVEKYNPIIIALVGSRAKGLNKETSDWDLYLFIDDKKRRLGEFVDYQG